MGCEVKMRNTVMLPLISAIEAKANIANTRPIIVAVDGCCGSGKTYYAKALAEYFNASVIHCDDFFLPKELRTRERLDEVGGNIHYERLLEVITRVRQFEPFTYQAFDCSTGDFVNRQFEPTNVVVVEGSYALHPTLRSLYDVKAVLTVSQGKQRARLLKREGVNFQNFVNKWIPLENRYFDVLDTTDCIVIDTD